MENYKLNKEEISRRLIFACSGNFLEIGAGSVKLRYLLGVDRGKFKQGLYEKNLSLFNGQFNYTATDLQEDASSPNFAVLFPHDYFDVIYSNNTFEHLRRPWVAVQNIYKLLKPGGLCVIIAPFAWRYHEVPGDYFRYTHTAIPAMFEDCGPVEVIVSGYDMRQRRDNDKGTGKFNDKVPLDWMGGWRESWQVITAVIKK